MHTNDASIIIIEQTSNIDMNCNTSTKCNTSTMKKNPSWSKHLLFLKSYGNDKGKGQGVEHLKQMKIIVQF